MQWCDDRPVFIEACCGSAILSQCVGHAGFETVAVDFEGNKHRPFVHVLKLDLRQDSSWSFLEFVCKTRMVLHFHGAPPCGTASRARDIPMSSDEHGPPPLRSELHPEGLPGLTKFWKNRVDSANAIYERMCNFCFFLNVLSITWSLENPGNSYMWMLPYFMQLATTAWFVYFHSCVHGGDRKKLTGVLTTGRFLEALEGYCDGSHDHKPWGLLRTADGDQFATSTEAAYPRLLCERFATLLLLEANSKGLMVGVLQNEQPRHDARVAAGKQPRGRKIRAIISEYGRVQLVTVPKNKPPKLCDKHLLCHPFHDVPAGSKLLRSSPAKRGSSGTNVPSITYVFGVFRECKQFFKDAQSLMHPFDSFSAVPDHVLLAIYNVLTCSPLVTMKRRLQRLHQWKQWASELEATDKSIFQQMDGGCAAVLKGKRLALLEKLATEVNWQDKDVHEQLRKGFRLVGVQRPTGVFGNDVKPNTTTEAELMKRAQFIQPSIWGKLKSAKREEGEQAIWDLTQEEVHEKNWLQGPYSKTELDTLFGSWIPVRRFGVRQKDKWRCIDDYTECGVNACFGSFEKIDLRALDEIVWVVSCLVKMVLHRESVRVQFSDGSVLEGKLDKFWKEQPEKAEVMIKTVDLKSAYKQLAIAPEDRAKSIISLRKPGTAEVFGYVSRTLPFGSVASVLHFNRVARLLHRLGSELDVAWSNYFDDYPIVSFKALHESTTSAVRAMMALLGFECSLDKEEDFASAADLLGVRLDLSSAMKGDILVGNTERRNSEMREVVKDLLAAKEVEPRKLPSLFGRALFVESQLLGRAGKLALAQLRHLEFSTEPSVKFGPEEIEALKILETRYVNAIPRKISTSREELPILLFTDGACEMVDDRLLATVGAVMYIPGKNECLAFGCEVDPDMLQYWEDSGKVHPVALTELYAVCLARSTWSEFLNGRRVIIFIDNQGTLDACIKCYSREQCMQNLLLHYERLDSCLPMLGWYARVPSKSNIGDLPSRGEWDELSKIVKYVRVSPSCFASKKLLKPI